jgi:hypothetical protein
MGETVGGAVNRAENWLFEFTWYVTLVDNIKQCIFTYMVFAWHGSVRNVPVKGRMGDITRAGPSQYGDWRSQECFRSWLPKASWTRDFFRIWRVLMYDFPDTFSAALSNSNTKSAGEARFLRRIATLCVLSMANAENSMFLHVFAGDQSMMVPAVGADREISG